MEVATETDEREDPNQGKKISWTQRDKGLCSAVLWFPYVAMNLQASQGSL